MINRAAGGSNASFGGINGGNISNIPPPNSTKPIMEQSQEFISKTLNTN